MEKVMENISETEIMELINKAIEEGVDVDYYEGILRDNYIFHYATNLTICGKNATFIILRVVPTSEWSSDVEVILTNSVEDVEEFEKLFNN